MPKFPKSSGFKMKGYTYPGTSPINIKDAKELTDLGDQRGGVGDLSGLATQIGMQIVSNALQTGTINSEKRVRANKIKAEAANFPTPQTTTKIV